MMAMINYLRHPILIGTLIILTVLFFFGGPDYYSPRSFQAVWNLGHVIYFALLALVVLSWPSKKPRGPVIQVFIVLGLTSGLGAVVELIQAGFQRTPDSGDLFRDLIGALCGIVFLWPIFGVLVTKTRRVFQMITIALVVAQIYPVAVALIDEHRARSLFPVLSDFESPFEIQRWHGGADFRIDHIVYHSGQSSLRVNLNTDQYSGISLQYFPHNWHGFSQFQFCAYNPSSQILSITCRINDIAHSIGGQFYSDRFNRTYTLAQGWNTITIPIEDIQSAPATRSMDLKYIRDVGIFVIQLPHPRLIYIDDVKLL